MRRIPSFIFLCTVLTITLTGCGGGGSSSSGGGSDGAGSGGSTTVTATYTGNATVKINRRGGAEIYQVPVLVRVNNPSSLETINGTKDPNPVYLRIEPSPPGSIQTATGLGDFLIETSTTFGPGFISSATQIYQYWSLSVNNNIISATLVDQHLGPNIITNYIWLKNTLLTGSAFMLRLSQNSTLTATSVDNGLQIKINGNIDDTINLATLAPFTIEMIVTK